MDKPSITSISLQQHQPSSLYSEQETIAACHLNIGVLRRLRMRGLVVGQETDGELQYSEEEVARLRRIRRLQNDLGINLAGVEVILHLLALLEAAHQELAWEKKSHER
ncbi:MAG TPA: chaperone modulator CbpM [Ktedonobacteraceae bacterium]|nr:chaperone modulator CbpM [Ktedonobacteraceae bacterium]